MASSELRWSSPKNPSHCSIPSNCRPSPANQHWHPRSLRVLRYVHKLGYAWISPSPHQTVNLTACSGWPLPAKTGLPRRSRSGTLTPRHCQHRSDPTLVRRAKPSSLCTSGGCSGARCQPRQHRACFGPACALNSSRGSSALLGPWQRASHGCFQCDAGRPRTRPRISAAGVSRIPRGLACPSTTCGGLPPLSLLGPFAYELHGDDLLWSDCGVV
mmetsp:Transcript_57799/g.161293  ORF Transcript_57799/g.161293 Transcript_57799/m.161293 type:complete len:215 (-) Transcript_57799:878-1522(-)